LRIVPKLNFIFDETGRRGQHLSALIDLAISKEMPADDAGQQDTDQKDLESDSEEA
jgi:ribosome-binding factor A